MSHRTVVVTGATEGIGFQTALQIAALGDWRVLVHGRSEEKANATVKSLQGKTKVPSAQFEPVWGDLSSLAQVRSLAEQIRSAAPVLDVLINNAGVFMKQRVLTADGFETTFQVNHLAPFQLTHLVMESLQAAAKARVVNVASGVHSSGEVNPKDLSLERGYDGFAAYANSKLCNVLFTHELARRLPKNIITSALHPGVIATKLLRNGWGSGGGSSLESGAKMSVYCATAPELEKVTGRYYTGGGETKSSGRSNDPKMEKWLYEESCKLTGVEPLTAS